MPKLYAGTSGFAYPTWKPRFYPADLPAKKFLEYYARRLNSVEINYTFRRLAAASTLENWIKATEPGFLFAPKAHQRLTHMLRLKDAAEFTEIFLRSIDPLRATHRLGPVLFQLPPYFQYPLLLRVPARLLAGRRGLRPAQETQHCPLLGGIRETRSSGSYHRRLRLFQAPKSGIPAGGT